MHQKELQCFDTLDTIQMESSAEDDTPVKTYSRKRSVSGTLFSKSICEGILCVTLNVLQM